MHRVIMQNRRPYLQKEKKNSWSLGITWLPLKSTSAKHYASLEAIKTLAADPPSFDCFLCVLVLFYLFISDS